VTSAFAKPPKRLFNRWLVVKYLGFFLLIAAAIGTAYYVLGTRSHISPTPQLKEESYKAYRNGDFRGAIVKLTAYLKNNGSDQEARNVLITSYAQVGDLKAALKENETLVKAKPHDAGALCRAGQLSNQLGRSADAIAYFKRATTIDPSVVQFHYQMAETYTNRRLYAKALTQWRATLETLPGNSPARSAVYKKIGDIYTILEEPGKAKKAYRKASATNTVNSTRNHYEKQPQKVRR